MTNKGRRALVLAGLCVCLVGSPCVSAAGPLEEVTAATRAWGTAYDTRDPRQILARYAPDAVFWGTGSATLRATPEEIADYFKTAPAQPNGRVEFGDFKVRVWGDVAVSTGGYTFTDVRDGQTIRRPARFSFVFRRVNGQWLIVDHHSSAVPAARP